MNNIEVDEFSILPILMYQPFTEPDFVFDVFEASKHLSINVISNSKPHSPRNERIVSFNKKTANFNLFILHHINAI